MTQMHSRFSKLACVLTVQRCGPGSLLIEPKNRVDWCRPSLLNMIPKIISETKNFYIKLISKPYVTSDNSIEVVPIYGRKAFKKGLIRVINETIIQLHNL